MDYPELCILSDEDESMLRKLVDTDKKRDSQVGDYLYSVSRNNREGTLIRHLDQAHMLNVDYKKGDPNVLEVYAAGYSYVAAMERRKAERKEDMRHDWKISVFTAFAGITGVVLGFVLGRL